MGGCGAAVLPGRRHPIPDPNPNPNPNQNPNPNPNPNPTPTPQLSARRHHAKGKYHDALAKGSCHDRPPLRDCQPAESWRQTARAVSPQSSPRRPDTGFRGSVLSPRAAAGGAEEAAGAAAGAAEAAETAEAAAAAVARGRRASAARNRARREGAVGARAVEAAAGQKASGRAKRQLRGSSRAMELAELAAFEAALCTLRWSAPITPKYAPLASPRPVSAAVAVADPLPEAAAAGADSHPLPAADPLGGTEVRAAAMGDRLPGDFPGPLLCLGFG